MSPLVNITVPMGRWLDNVLGVESLKKSKESKEAWLEPTGRLFPILESKNLENRLGLKRALSCG